MFPPGRMIFTLPGPPFRAVPVWQAVHARGSSPGAPVSLGSAPLTSPRRRKGTAPAIAAPMAMSLELLRRIRGKTSGRVSPDARCVNNVKLSAQTGRGKC